MVPKGLTCWLLLIVQQTYRSIRPMSLLDENCIPQRINIYSCTLSIPCKRTSQMQTNSCKSSKEDHKEKKKKERRGNHGITGFRLPSTSILSLFAFFFYLFWSFIDKILLPSARTRQKKKKKRTKNSELLDSRSSSKNLVNMWSDTYKNLFTMLLIVQRHHGIYDLHGLNATMLSPPICFWASVYWSYRDSRNIIMYRLIGQLRRGRAISKGISTYLSLPTQERGWNNIANVAGIDSLFYRLHEPVRPEALQRWSNWLSCCFTPWLFELNDV